MHFEATFLLFRIKTPSKNEIVRFEQIVRTRYLIGTRE